MLDWNNLNSALSSEFHFLRPEWFWGLLPVLLFILWLSFERKNTGEWQRLIPNHLLKHLLAEQNSSSTKSALTLLSLIWILAIIALAGPSWKKIPQPVYEKLQARVYILDLSYSMYAADLKPSRISRARLKLIDLLKNQREGLNALVVYAGDAHIVTPLSSDVNTIISLIPSLEPAIMPKMGSNTSAAIDKAITLFSNIQAANAHIVGGEIILLTDEITSEQITKIKNQLSRQPYQLSILGVGTKEGAPINLPNGQFFKDNQGNIILPKLNNAELQKLAETSGGRYIDIQKDDSDVSYLQSLNSFTDTDQVRASQQNFDIWEEAGYWLLFPIALLSALAFRRGWILSVLMLISLGTYQDPVYAEEKNRDASLFKNTWNTLWLNGDQRGLRAFHKGHFDQAASTFNSSAWRASALYKNNQFDEAAENFARHIENNKSKSHIGNTEHADNWYNLGNALAKAGNLEKAINAYEQSLSFQTDHEDALFNKALLEKLKDQQEEQKQQGEGNSEENQQGEHADSSAESRTDKNTKANENNNEESGSESSNEQNSPTDENQQKEENASDEKSQQTQEQKSEQQDSRNSEAKSQENSANEQETDESKSITALEREQQQALEQWLRQIPDDPSGLLRRKFQIETEKNRPQQNRSNNQQAW